MIFTLINLLHEFRNYKFIYFEAVHKQFIRKSQNLLNIDFIFYRNWFDFSLRNFSIFCLNRI